MTDWASLTAPEKIAAVQNAWWSGCTLTGLGRVLGASRNAIAGVYNRNKEMYSTHPLSSAAGKAQSKRIGKRKMGSAGKRLICAALKMRAIARGEVEAQTFHESPSVEDRRHTVYAPLMFNRGCKYAMNDPEPRGVALFCGEVLETGKSWCDRHATIVYQPVKARVR